MAAVAAPDALAEADGWAVFVAQAVVAAWSVPVVRAASAVVPQACSVPMEQVAPVLLACSGPDCIRHTFSLRQSPNADVCCWRCGSRYRIGC